MNVAHYIKGLITLCLILILAGGCGDSSTQPDIPDQSGIYSSLISVAMVPGASETMTIKANDPNGLPETYTASCDNGAVATVTLSDALVEVTGVGYGEATVTITAGSGSIKEIPVQVYNHRVLDTGELLITYVDSFEALDVCQDWYIVHPLVPEGFHALGSVFTVEGDPNGRHAVAVVKQKDDNSQALAQPEEYVYEWGGPTFRFWQPVAPQGYRAMGTVGTARPDYPSDDYVVCVREDLTILGEAGDDIQNLAWEIDPPAAGPHSSCHLQAGTFVTCQGGNPLDCHDVMNVLKVELPMLAEAPLQDYVPRLDSYNEPPEETVPVMAKAMLVPCTIVTDYIYDDNMEWRVANSPFYRLERHVFYKRLYHNYNQTSEVQTNQVMIRSGVTTTESESFKAETAISITAESGVSFEIFSGKVSSTVSVSFGYETQTSVTELEEKEVTSSINTPPGKAAALWQKYNRYILKRHNGIYLDPVAVWEFGIDSYVTDEYPD